MIKTLLSMSVQSNAKEVIAKNLKTLQDLMDADKVLRSAALNTIAVISHRVQQQGTNSEGKKMETKSSKKHGAYSFYYGQEREKDGFQVDHIDLTVTGGLMDSLNVEPDGKNGYIVGLVGDRASDLADYNEERFGPIFELSIKEADIIFGEVIDNVNEIIRRNS